VNWACPRDTREYRYIPKARIKWPSLGDSANGLSELSAHMYIVHFLRVGEDGSCTCGLLRLLCSLVYAAGKNLMVYLWRLASCLCLRTSNNDGTIVYPCPRCNSQEHLEARYSGSFHVVAKGARSRSHAEPSVTHRVSREFERGRIRTS
jgi:hypothetical protein